MGIKPCICKHECEKIVYNQNMRASVEKHAKFII